MTTKFRRVKVANGEFECFWGDQDTGFRIFNGCHGSSRRENIYGVTTPARGGIPSKIHWFGPLATATTMAQRWIERRAAKGQYR